MAGDISQEFTLGAIAVILLHKPFAADMLPSGCGRAGRRICLFAPLSVAEPTRWSLSRLCRGEASLPRAVEAHLMGAGWPFTARGGSLLVNVPARRA